MRVVIYVRVSTDMQSEEGYSLDAQIDRCKAYCVSQGWEVIEVYVEEGESAKDMNRPELQRLLLDAENGLFDVLLVYKLDRLTRSVRDLHVILDTFETLGIKFRSATEVYDTTTAMGKLFITIVAALAEWERGNLAERVRFGMEELVRQGKWHGGPVPYGYSWDGTTMTIIPNEAAVLREVRRLYMSGLGFGGVAKVMNDRGVYRRSGDLWSAQTVYYVLDNPIYAGKLRYGGKNKKGKYLSKKKDESVDLIWSDSGFPTIFTWEEYEEHTKRMKRRQFYGTSRNTDYWFSGVIRCARCGSAMVGKPHRPKRADGTLINTYISYMCGNRQQNRSCNLPLLKQPLAESIIIEHIKGIKLTHDEVAAAGEQSALKIVEHQSDMESLQRELKAIAERRRKWQYMFAEDMMSEPDFRARKREEDEKEAFVMSQIEEVRASEIGVHSSFVDTLLDLPTLWSTLNDGEKKEMMQTIFESIYFDCDVQTGQGFSAKGKTLPFRITEINFN